MFRLLTMATIIMLSSNVNGETMTDPTKPMNMVSKADVTALVEPVDTEFKLNAIKISTKGTVATINGKAVKVGDQVGDRKVIQIKASKVVFESADGPSSLQFNKKSIKNLKSNSQEVMVQ